MELKKFKKNQKRNNIIIISLTLILGILIGIYFNKTHAYFETGKTYNVLEGRIPNFAKGDILLSVIVDGEQDKSGIFPDKKNHRYIDSDDACTNGATLEWDKKAWQAIVRADKPTVCTLRFETFTSKNLIDILKNSGELVTLTHNDTV